MNGANIPAAFDPPPTHATTASGSRPIWSRHWAFVSPADHRLEVADDHRKRVRPDHAADRVVRRLRRAHPVAHRFVGRVSQGPRAGRHRHDRRAQRPHVEDVELLAADVFLAHVDRAFDAERAQAVAVATPCWPAPVSAITRVLFIRWASMTWPIALLILWAPVWFRSSRLR